MREVVAQPMRHIILGKDEFNFDAKIYSGFFLHKGGAFKGPARVTHTKQTFV